MLQTFLQPILSLSPVRPRHSRRLNQIAVFCLVLVSLGGLGGCVTLKGPGERMVKTELLFGDAKLNGGTVSPKEWQSFVDKEITPRFPEGLTIMNGAGQWRTKSGTFIRENTRILVLIHKSSREDAALIAAIRESYRRQFGQELVLQVTSDVRASF